MPRPRFQRLPADKREAVLAAAAREFATQGYDGASVNRIVLAAGFSKASFYYYFDDTADLAAAVLEGEVTRYLELWSQLATPTTVEQFWAEVTHMMELGKAEMRENQYAGDALIRLGTAIARDPELFDRLAGPMIQDATARASAFWKRGQDIGAVRSDLPLGTLLQLLQGIKMVVTSVVLPQDRAPTAEELETFFTVHLDLLRRVSEPRAGERRPPAAREQP